MIREVNITDYQNLANFLEKFSKPTLSKNSHIEKFKIWWDENSSFESDARGWIALSDNEIVGFLGNIPANYLLNDQLIKTASPSTWCVSPNGKHQAMGLLFPYLAQKKDILVNSTPAQVTEEIFRKLGFKDLSTSLKSYIYVLSPRTLNYFIGKKITQKFLASLLSKLSYFILKLWQVLTKPNIPELSIIEKDLAADQFKDQLVLKDLGWLKKPKFNIKSFEIRSGDKILGNMITQSVHNLVNQLQYLEILYFSGTSLGPIINLQDELLKAYALTKIDFIIISNLQKQVALRLGFIDVTKYHRVLCLVKGKNVEDIKNLQVSSLFGEKGFMIWN